MARASPPARPAIASEVLFSSEGIPRRDCAAIRAAVLPSKGLFEPTVTFADAGNKLMA